MENLPGIFLEKVKILLGSIPYSIALDLFEVIANKCREIKEGSLYFNFNIFLL